MDKYPSDQLVRTLHNKNGLSNQIIGLQLHENTMASLQSCSVSVSAEFGVKESIEPQQFLTLCIVGCVIKHQIQVPVQYLPQDFIDLIWGPPSSILFAN